MLMGKQLAGMPGEIVGVPTTRPAETVRRHIAGTIKAAVRRFGFAIEVPKTIHLLDGEAGFDQDLELMVQLAREEGLLLDPIYTARGFRVLVETLARDPKAVGPRVCFVHTGGPFGGFPLRERLSGLIDHRSADP